MNNKTSAPERRKPAATKTKQTAPRILVLDIELSPLTVFAWGCRDQFINLDAVLEDWSVLSFCGKWYGSKRVIYRDTSGRGPAKIRDDRKLLGELAELLDQADVVVGHNVRGFDLKKISSRMIQHRMPPHSPVRVIDTLGAAKRAGAFSSNKLAYLAEKLTSERKDSHSKYPGMSLWKACLADDPAAWRVMRRYNVADVLATEELYTTLRPWVASHPNVTLFADSGEQVCCPRCGSAAVQTRGVITTQTGKFQRVHCTACGGWTRSKKNLISADTRKKALTTV
jgi:RNase_H superfamily